ncbi:MAG: biosynthetic-type acetolactate synthase large subunit [Cytophagales bacterium]
MIKLRGADYMVRIMELIGVKELFAYPGGAILPLYDALAFSNIDYILVRHEQAAAFAANGYARVKNEPGFCLATSGPGATNLVTGIADAYADSVPMIAITGQVNLPLIGTDAFQETDIPGLCLPLTNTGYLVKKLEDAQEIFRNAYETAVNGRPGPVLIDVPRSVQLEYIELDDDWEEQFVKPKHTRIYNVADAELEKFTHLISQAKKPLIIAGHGNLLSDSWQELRAFVEREQIPAVSTILGMGVLKDEDPMYFSWLGMHGMKYANLAVQEADLIIALGIRFDDRITGRLKDFAPNAKIIHADIDISEKSKNVSVECFLHGDLKLILSKINDTRTDQNIVDRKVWLAYLNGLKEKYPIKEVDYDVFNMITAIDVLEKLSPEDIIVATDVGQHQMWAGQYLNKMHPNHFLTSGGLGSMGFGFPAAMGAQAAAKNKHVWCISGDGSFQMNLQELITCVQEQWPVKILLLDNNYLGMVRQWQEQFYKKNYSGVDILNPDYVKLAEAYGVGSAAATNVAELKDAIDLAYKTPGPFLVHAKVLKEDNVLPMVAPGASLSETIYYPVELKRKTGLKEKNAEKLLAYKV